MFTSNSQSATFFFVTDVTRASDRSTLQPAVTLPTPTAPVRLIWVAR